MRACLGLVELRPIVFRGNASEILALAGAQRIKDSKGSDSSHESLDVVDAAKSLAVTTGAIVAVYGALDCITNGNARSAYDAEENCNRMCSHCLHCCPCCSGFIQAFQATACALSIFGLAGKLGMDMARGPASLNAYD